MVPYDYRMAMTKTTVYLPDELKARLRRAAEQRGVSEARFIRESLEGAVDAVRPRPRGGFIVDSTEPIDWTSDEHLTGFGDR
jgi:hypothetical protein